MTGPERTRSLSMREAWRILPVTEICRCPFTLRRTYAQKQVTEAQFRTGAVMRRLGFPIRAVAITIGRTEFTTRHLYGEVPNQCAVPGCEAALSTENKSGVCRNHNHDPEFCRCFRCEHRRAADA